MAKALGTTQGNLAKLELGHASPGTEIFNNAVQIAERTGRPGYFEEAMR